MNHFRTLFLLSLLSSVAASGRQSFIRVDGDRNFHAVAHTNFGEATAGYPCQLLSQEYSSVFVCTKDDGSTIDQNEIHLQEMGATGDEKEHSHAQQSFGGLNVLVGIFSNDQSEIFDPKRRMKNDRSNRRLMENRAIGVLSLSIVSSLTVIVLVLRWLHDSMQAGTTACFDNDLECTRTENTSLAGTICTKGEFGLDRSNERELEEV